MPDVANIPNTNLYRARAIESEFGFDHGYYWSDNDEKHYIRKIEGGQIVDIEVDKKTLCKISDLVDKNGRFIHELDIVERPYDQIPGTEKMLVIFHGGGFRLLDKRGIMSPIIEEMSDDFTKRLDEFSIIGDIISNPELFH